MKGRFGKMFSGKSRKMAGNGNQRALQGATAAAVVGGAGLAGFYAWQAANRKKPRGFMNMRRSAAGSRFNLFSR